MPDLSDENVSLTLEQILAERPFGAESGAGSLLAALWEMLRGLGGQIAASSRPVFWVTMTGLMVLLVLLLWHIGYTLRIAVAAWRPSSVTAAAAAAAKPVDFGPLERALREGDARAAIELSWQLVAVHLAHGDFAGHTPRQWARAIRGRLDLEGRQDLELVLRLHEAACYAGEPLELAAASRAAQACHRLIEMPA
jgi:hypothetical protein